MPSDKGRLYIALYARGGKPTMPGEEDRYHWALIFGPKDEKAGMQGVRYHAINRTDGWIFEERSASLEATNMLLVRVIIGKVVDTQGLRRVMHNIQVQNNNPAWNCVAWIKDALVKLAEGNIMGTSQLDWQTVRDTALRYIEEKRAQHRFDGKAQKGQFDIRKPATFDLLTGKEVIP
ncbi:hypothetical protein MMC27_007008 [Xylographa pallens]|nr:hypothetical protein [Xylographa pallens]